MAVQWSPDSCDCVIIQSQPWVWAGTVKKCKLHQSFNGQELLDAIKTHRIPFNDNPVNEIPTEFLREAKDAGVSVKGWALIKERQDIITKLEAQDTIVENRQAEKERIRNLTR